MIVFLRFTMIYEGLTVLVLLQEHVIQLEHLYSFDTDSVIREVMYQYLIFISLQFCIMTCICSH